MPTRAQMFMGMLCCVTVTLAGAGSAVAQVCTSEQFNYPDGPLDGNGGWSVTTTGAADPADISIAGGSVTIDGANAPFTDQLNAILPVDCDPCEDGIITVKFKIKGNGVAGNFWGVFFDDSDGSTPVNLAQFYRSATELAGRVGGLAGGYLTDFLPMSTTTFDECMAVIDTRNDVTTFYLNGILMTASPDPVIPRRNPISHGIEGGASQNPGNHIGRIRLQRAGTNVTGIVTLDDFEIVSCPGTCSVKVTPTAAHLAYAELNGAVTPADVVYTVTNDNQDTIDYAVQEVDAAGAPHDYPWVSLDKSGGTSLATTQTDTVTASLISTGLSEGVHVAYVKFTDSCAPERSYIRAIKLFVESCLTEDFNYANGRMDRAPGWTSQAVGVTYPAQLDTGVLRVDGGAWPTFTNGPVSNANLVVNHVVPAACPACSVNGGLISVKIKAKGGSGVSNFWRLFITDSAGLEIASWAGTGTGARGRVDNPAPNGSAVTDTVDLSTTTFDVLEARINTDDTRTIGGVPPNWTLFLINGVPVPASSGNFNPLPHLTGAGDAVGNLHIDRLNSAGADGDFILFDDLTVGRCTEQCNDPVFDVRDTTNATVQDGKVTVHDFNIFQSQCATGPTPGAAVFDALSFECRCMDVDGNQAVDMNDFGRFQRCYTGLDGTVDPACDD